MDELEAMNMLLRAIGSSPVNSLDTPHPDAANAKVSLDRARKQGQKRGWWFNIDYGVTFTPDPVSGAIAVPATISKAVFNASTLVIRGGKLYDSMNQTYYFATAQHAVRIQYITPWDEMPQSLQEYCAYVAAAQFVRDELEDINKMNSFREDAGLAMIDVKRDDLEQGQYNIFNRKRVQQARVGVRPYATN